jgi:hypothetical protein
VNEGKELGPPNWLPLETKLRESGRPVSLCAAFMWMWRERGIDFYKHIDTRRYLLLDSHRRCWRQGPREPELADFECEFHRVRSGMPTVTVNSGPVQIQNPDGGSGTFRRSAWTTSGGRKITKL